VGDEFLGFRLVGELGRGTFGTVYLARQGDLANRPVALKVSQAPSGEPQTLAQLQHTNIVPIYSIHRVGSLQAVCMPYFGSVTLRDVYNDLESQGSLPVSGRGLLVTLYESKAGAPRPGDSNPHDSGAGQGRDGPSSEPRAEAAAPPTPGASTGTLGYLEGLTYVQAVLWMASRLVSGLAHAHERGIVHRDLKPANVLLTDDGQPMLLDFNLSEDIKIPPGAAAGIGGTLHYMAPEHLDAFRGSPRRLDARSDLYSVGVILYELLTGRRPFTIPDGPSGTLIDRLIEDRHQPLPSVRCWNKDVSPAVESIIHHCLEPDPARRYQTALELHEDVERHLANRPLRYAAEPSPRERLGKWARRHPTACSSTTISSLGLALVALLGALGWVKHAEYRDAWARSRHAAFREAFEACQLLLNTYTEDGPSEHLAAGTRLALRALGDYGIGGPGDWTSSPPVRYLSDAGERRALRQELSELIQLEARARVAMAERGRSEAELRGALQWGVARLSAAERLDPRAPASLFDDRARFHAALGRRDLAARDRALAGRVPPATARDYYLQGTSLLACGDVDRAELPLSRAVDLDPRRFWAWFALGICHSDQRRYSDAAFDFSVCTTLEPHFTWPHLNRGLALARSGRLPEARLAYCRALELAPGLTEALIDRALVELELDNAAQALRDLEAAISSGRRTPIVLTARAEALARLGRRPEAEQAYAAVVRALPGDPTPLVARGFSRLASDRAGAEADFADALSLDPHNARAQLGRAYLLRRADPRAALARVESALAEEPDFNDALQLRALLRARLGDPAAEADVDRLLQTPTPQRLYNAACALSLLATPRGDPRLISRALDCLQRALDSGLPPAYPADDPDLDALRASSRFPSVLGPRPPTAHAILAADRP
jgi:serine/threonine protein kinase/tetratricopeptide (TPR) repeat protein